MTTSTTDQNDVISDSRALASRDGDHLDPVLPQGISGREARDAQTENAHPASVKARHDPTTHSA